MLCPSCNKFCAFSTDNEPEADLNIESTLATVADANSDDKSKEIDDPDNAIASITGSVRIVLTSECCGDEMKESTFDISDLDVEITRAEGCACDLTSLDVESSSSEITDRTANTKVTIAKRGPNKGQQVIKHIPSRYAKRFYGCSVEIEVSCKCGKTTSSATFTDEVQASGMDEMV